MILFKSPSLRLSPPSPLPPPPHFQFMLFPSLKCFFFVLSLRSADRKVANTLKKEKRNEKKKKHGEESCLKPLCQQHHLFLSPPTLPPVPPISHLSLKVTSKPNHWKKLSHSCTSCPCAVLSPLPTASPPRPLSSWLVLAISWKKPARPDP